MKIDRPFEQLPLWKDLMDFVRTVYLVTSTFPTDEKEGITRKIRNTVTDVPVFIASGISSRISNDSKPYLQKASMALVETETLLLVCQQLMYLQPAEFESFQNQIMLINEELQHLIIRIGKKFN